MVPYTGNTDQIKLIPWSQIVHVFFMPVETAWAAWAAWTAWTAWAFQSWSQLLASNTEHSSVNWLTGKRTWTTLNDTSYQSTACHSLSTYSTVPRELGFAQTIYPINSVVDWITFFGQEGASFYRIYLEKFDWLFRFTVRNNSLVINGPVCCLECLYLETTNSKNTQRCTLLSSFTKQQPPPLNFQSKKFSPLEFSVMHLRS